MAKTSTLEQTEERHMRQLTLRATRLTSGKEAYRGFALFIYALYVVPNLGGLTDVRALKTFRCHTRRDWSLDSVSRNTINRIGTKTLLLQID